MSHTQLASVSYGQSPNPTDKAFNREIVVLLSRRDCRGYLALTPPLYRRIDDAVRSYLGPRCNLAAQRLPAEHIFRLKWPLESFERDHLYNAVLRHALPEFAVELRVRPAGFKCRPAQVG